MADRVSAPSRPAMPTASGATRRAISGRVQAWSALPRSGRRVARKDPRALDGCELHLRRAQPYRDVLSCARRGAFTPSTRTCAGRAVRERRAGHRAVRQNSRRSRPDGSLLPRPSRLRARGGARAVAVCRSRSPGVSGRCLRMRLGAQHVTFVQPDAPGAPYPADAGCDRSGVPAPRHRRAQHGSGEHGAFRPSRSAGVDRRCCRPPPEA